LIAEKITHARVHCPTPLREISPPVLRNYDVDLPRTFFVFFISSVLVFGVDVTQSPEINT